jgi:hypothetical protein
VTFTEGHGSWSAERWVADEVVCSADRGQFVSACLYAARHLAVAASRLARDGGFPRGLAIRAAEAEALFRAQVAALDTVAGGPIARWPAVRLADGVMVSLTPLCASALQGRVGWDGSPGPIDQETVHEVVGLLCGLRWYLPREAADESRVFLPALAQAREGALMSSVPPCQ